MKSREDNALQTKLGKVRLLEPFEGIEVVNPIDNEKRIRP